MCSAKENLGVKGLVHWPTVVMVRVDTDDTPRFHSGNQQQVESSPP